MRIGIPKEIMRGERRVAATPETVSKLVNDGHSVIIERSAGEGAFYSDAEYAGAGADISDSAAGIYESADIIFKVKEPQYNGLLRRHETDMLREGQYLLAFLHPAAPANHEMVRAMAAGGVVGLTLDGIPRTPRTREMDALASMSVCAGYKGMLMAMDLLPVFVPRMDCAAGIIEPVKVLVIGAGAAGRQAIATARGLGADVYAADIRPDVLARLKSEGVGVVGTTVPENVAVGGDGGVNALSEEWLINEREALREIITQCDIVLTSVLIPGRVAPVMITEETAAGMKPGSVIVDISVDQGGNCAATVPGETVVKHGVHIIGIKNIPGMLPKSATWMFANNIYEMFKYLTRDGKIELDTQDEIARGILVTYGGKVVHEGTLEAMGQIK